MTERRELTTQEKATKAGKNIQQNLEDVTHLVHKPMEVLLLVAKMTMDINSTNKNQKLRNITKTALKMSLNDGNSQGRFFGMDLSETKPFNTWE